MWMRLMMLPSVHAPDARRGEQIGPSSWSEQFPGQRRGNFRTGRMEAPGAAQIGSRRDFVQDARRVTSEGATRMTTW
jgi:hypothetical protein